MKQDTAYGTDAARRRPLRRPDAGRPWGSRAGRNGIQGYRAVLRRAAAGALALALLAAGPLVSTAAAASAGVDSALADAASPAASAGTETARTESAATAAAADFAAYQAAHDAAPWAAGPLTLGAGQVTAYTGGEGNVTHEGRAGAYRLETGQAITWTFEVPADGKYGLELDYCPLPGRGADIVLSVAVDGAIPFTEAENAVLTRCWRDAGPITRDAGGNDILPAQEEAFVWMTRALRDTSAYTDTPFYLYMTAGTHTLTLTAVTEAAAVGELRLTGEEEPPTYAAYAAGADEALAAGVADAYIPVEAETPAGKSHAMIYATSDYTSPATSPADPVKIRLNTLGQTGWKYAGQWVSWTVHTEKAGYYRLSFKYRQNFIRGFAVSRRLTINGEVPFREAEKLTFAYNSDFDTLTLGDERNGDYLFYLKEGDNTITMEVVLGDIGEVLVEANRIVYELNARYREIIMITGQDPDALRDYYLDRELPDLLPAFAEQAAALRACVDTLEAQSFSGSQASLFDQVAYQLETFVKKPETIPKQLASFRNNLSALASAVLEFKEQPLELDYLIASGRDAALPASRAGFFASAWFQLRAFAGSFFEDYNAVGVSAGGGEPLRVWANGDTTGREQLAVLKRLIDNEFTPETGTPVQLSLVSGGQIMTQAILAGAGPDVAIFADEATPINLSMRGALEDLSAYPGYEELTDWFYPSAFTPYEYEGGIYALPETQLYNMLFYRTDVFEELQLTAPASWDDFFVVSSTLQKNHLDIGIPEDIKIFESLVLQNGGEFFAPGNVRTGFDSQEALTAFTLWTSFYKDYSYPVSFDAYSRFRTGEMPVVIMPFNFYSTLTVAAPELRGKWAMAPLPGTVDAEGNLNRTESCTGTGALLLADTAPALKQTGFDFIKWWVSPSVQAAYGNGVEAQMGAGARYATANREAFPLLPWTLEEQALLSAQWEAVQDVPVIPGNYDVVRNLNNAFRRVVYYQENPRETLGRYNNMINKEIRRKRLEYGLPAD